MEGYLYTSASLRGPSFLRGLIIQIQAKLEPTRNPDYTPFKSAGAHAVIKAGYYMPTQA
jgi:hypothetical protein